MCVQCYISILVPTINIEWSNIGFIMNYVFVINKNISSVLSVTVPYLLVAKQNVSLCCFYILSYKKYAPLYNLNAFFSKSHVGLIYAPEESHNSDFSIKFNHYFFLWVSWHIFNLCVFLRTLFVAVLFIFLWVKQEITGSAINCVDGTVKPKNTHNFL